MTRARVAVGGIRASDLVMAPLEKAKDAEADERQGPPQAGFRAAIRRGRAEGPNGSSIKRIASKCPADKGQSARNSARELFSMSPAETASGQPIPGLTRDRGRSQ